MMLARVADSLYWIGRYVERAEHMCRLSDVMLNATLDRTEAAAQTARMALAAVGDTDASKAAAPWDAAYALTLDRNDGGSITSSLARARENAIAVRRPKPPSIARRNTSKVALSAALNSRGKAAVKRSWSNPVTMANRLR